jgi:hypothetical protein
MRKEPDSPSIPTEHTSVRKESGSCREGCERRFGVKRQLTEGQPNDDVTRTIRQLNKDSFKCLWTWFLPNEEIFSSITLHGNIKWTPVYLACLTLCWAWSDG